MLGRVVQDKNGKKQGNFGAIANALRNPSIVNADDREDLQLKLAEYKEVSMDTGQPIVFSTMGYPYLMGILPNYSEYEFYRLPKQIIVDFAAKLDYRQASDKDWYEEIRVWALQLGKKPSDLELRQKWHELTSYQLNDHGVQMLREFLDRKAS